MANDLNFANLLGRADLPCDVAARLMQAPIQKQFMGSVEIIFSGTALHYLTSIFFTITPFNFVEYIQYISPGLFWNCKVYFVEERTYYWRCLYNKGLVHVWRSIMRIILLPQAHSLLHDSSYWRKTECRALINSNQTEQQAAAGHDVLLTQGSVFLRGGIAKPSCP